MKLQQILSCNTLLENEADTSSDASLQSIWEQNSDSISSFRPNVEYSVKKVGDQFEVNKVVQDRRKLIKKISEDEYLLSARHEIDYLNDKYGWDLPYGDFETLSGLILSLTENLPNKGEFVSFGKYTFTIVSKEAHRIETVRLKINESENF